MDRLKIKSQDSSDQVVVVTGSNPRDCLIRFVRIYAAKYQIEGVKVIAK